MKEFVVKSYIDLLTKFSENIEETKNYCFRGHSNADWSLVPTIYRGIDNLNLPPDQLDGKSIGQYERDIYREFARSKGGINPKINFENQFEELAVAQHLGVPTRLLDWTRNQLVATYFATNNNTKVDACIWALNLSHFPFEHVIGRQVNDGGFRIENIKNYIAGVIIDFLLPVSLDINGTYSSVRNLPNPYKDCLIFFESPLTEQRVQAQHGIFSIYLNSDDYVFEYDHLPIILEKEREIGADLLYKFIIPSAIKDDIYKGLRSHGINHFTVFPDSYGLAEKLREERDLRVALIIKLHKK